MLIQQVILALVIQCTPQSHVDEVCYVLPNGNNEYGMILETDKPGIGSLIPIRVTTVDDCIVETLYMVNE